MLIRLYRMYMGEFPYILYFQHIEPKSLQSVAKGGAIGEAGCGLVNMQVAI
jgi:hypothetical protein